MNLSIVSYFFYCKEPWNWEIESYGTTLCHMARQSEEWEKNDNLWMVYQKSFKNTKKGTSFIGSRDFIKFSVELIKITRNYLNIFHTWHALQKPNHYAYQNMLYLQRKISQCQTSRIKHDASKDFGKRYIFFGVL